MYMEVREEGEEWVRLGAYPALILMAPRQDKSLVVINLHSTSPRTQGLPRPAVLFCDYINRLFNLLYSSLSLLANMSFPNFVSHADALLTNSSYVLQTLSVPPLYLCLSRRWMGTLISLSTRSELATSYVSIPFNMPTTISLLSGPHGSPFSGSTSRTMRGSTSTPRYTLYTDHSADTPPIFGGYQAACSWTFSISPT